MIVTLFMKYMNKTLSNIILLSNQLLETSLVVLFQFSKLETPKSGNQMHLTSHLAKWLAVFLI